MRGPIGVQPLYGELVGRSRELAVVERFIDDLAGLPATLSLTGEAGIGKTTVWEWAIDAARARAFTCLTSRLARSKAQLAFAVLGDLLGESYPPGL